ncbi:MAG: DUF975 domain-containing protein [Okeania sp. SIO2G4]|uniref:hypothetical protein n=1 Tax=unclassified Okeania TaxID=2634635 RepID=UPI0013B810BA|nr:MULTISPECIES: hypothetical protein [unclassified Okeania]NEP04180.1 DUF975 domain-containing protein [Okeania sp. SIO4D6]NEP71665.1 DUF975 domain-containing protein [Okeania sp. SIO2G5]NEP91760.1 DUF975 domain-containing protein [Okeania sp. SIO2F5]NEQ89587.1 DUF975 domain-containing protein [Okeania sp. SIO2G4]
MSENSTTPIELLTVGNIVSAGMRIYRDHFQPYFGVAIRATLWSFLPFLALIPIPLILIYSQANSSSFLLLIPVWLLLLIYCSAKSIFNSAIIARLVFGELANQPETVREARRILKPKMWTFLLASFLLFLIAIGIWFILSMVIGILAGIIAGMANAGQQNVGTIVALVLIGIVIFIIALIFIIRLLTRFFVFDLPLAVEENITATQTLGRSWELTKGYVGRIFVVLFIATLVTIPIGIVVQIIAGILENVLKATIPVSPTDASFQLLLFLMGYSIGLLSNVFLLPFWQAIKAVVYYDLRTRREGMGLQLRKQDI